MICPYCGKEISDSSVFCASCRQLMTGVGPTLEPVKTKSGNTRKALLVIAALLIATPFLIGFRGFVRGFNSRMETTDQKVSRLMREAAGLQPVHTSIFGEDDVDTRMRELFRNVIRLNKEYQTAADKLDTSETGKLNTPESFADPGSAAEALKQLHAAYDLDLQQEQKIQQVLDNFRHQFDGPGFSASDRELFLNGFNKGLAQSAPKRQHAIATEKAWIEASDDVYGYARAHHKDFRLVSGQLSISGDAVLVEFNSKIAALNRRQQEFLQAKNEFDQMQKGIWQKTGIKPQDTGSH